MTTTINAASTGLVSSADSSTALAFQTAGTTAMTINSSQQVGIGNTSPTTTLGVTGSAYITGNITGANLILNGTAALGSGVLIVSGNIQTSTANATANIGNSSNYFNRLFAQSTTALYADLAEM